MPIAKINFKIELMFTFRENFMNLDVFFRELSYKEITQQKAYDMTNLWSELVAFIRIIIHVVLHL